MPDPQISVMDRLSQRAQIETVLERARMKEEPLRVRIPLTLYEYDAGRNYITLRDAIWNLQLPSETTTPEDVERVVEAMGVFIRCLGEDGVDETVAALTRIGL